MAKRRSLVFFVAFIASCTIAQVGGKRVSGQIRINGRPAPEGVLILLDRARGRDSSFINGSGELGNTMTDSRGKFAFENIDAGQEVPEGKVYVITVRYPGYHTATQIVDLTASPSGFASFELKRDTSRETPNVPPGGPAAAISARQPTSPKAREALARGEELLIQKHDPKQSINDFKKLLEIEPQYAPGYVLLGTAYLQIQQWAEARSAFERATKLQPDDPNAFLGLGLVLNEQNDFNAALKPLQHSLELRPQSAGAHYEAGRSLWALGRWQEAEPHARKALDLDSNFAQAHILMGNVYLRRRDANAALGEFREYLKREPQGRYAEPVKEMVEKIEKALAER